MSKFAQAATTSQTLSLAAMEEASRMGQREADLEHLLLALTLNEQPAGDALRSLGITVEAARKAIAEQRSTQLRSLGIDVAAAESGRSRSMKQTATNGASGPWMSSPVPPRATTTAVLPPSWWNSSPNRAAK